MLNAESKVQTLFHMVYYFLQHVNTVAKGLVDKLNYFHSLDEIIKLFKHCSSQMHKMKNKPIKKVFKFWAISCPISGFVY